MYNVSIDNGQVRISLEGSIQVKQAADLRDVLLDLADKGNRNFQINIEKVDYMDSTGLGVFVCLRNKLQESGGQVNVSGATGSVDKLFRMTRLNEIFY